jgi:uncharacterized protein with PIN domain
MVLDTSAVITMQLKEPGYRRVFERVEESAATFIGAPTLFESAMVLFGKVGADRPGC